MFGNKANDASQIPKDAQKQGQEGVKEAQNPQNLAVNVDKTVTNEAQIKDLTNSLQRLQAEFENYQKRNSKLNDEFKCFANAKLVEELLPVLDSLEAGMAHSKDLVIVHEQLVGILKKNGLTKIKAEKGKQFDHDLMECLMSETDPKLADGAVVNVLIAGYLFNGKILRPAKVSVNVRQKAEPVKKEEACKTEEVNKIDWEIQKMEE